MGNGIRRKDQKHTVRDRADLMWRDANINVYGFEDVNQMALDDRYGKVGAPLSKRRNGEGPAGRDAPPGLFGWNSLRTINRLTVREAIVPVGIGLAILGTIFKLKMR
jgi:hypothetical protein